MVLQEIITISRLHGKIVLWGILGSAGGGLFILFLVAAIAIKHLEEDMLNALW